MSLVWSGKCLDPSLARAAGMGEETQAPSAESAGGSEEIRIGGSNWDAIDP